MRALRHRRLRTSRCNRSAAIAVCAVLAAVLAPRPLVGQGSMDAGANAGKARATIHAMVQALGGEKWLTLENSKLHGRMSGFAHGKPTGGIMDYTELTKFPDLARLEFGKKGKWVQIFVGQRGWEITYQGVKTLPPDQVAGFVRRHNHSLQSVVRIWMKDPKTLLLYDGQSIAGRRLADKVTLIDADNDSVDIQTDAESHLPLSVSWQWRDPVYHDKDSEAIEYANYVSVQGIATAYDITTYRNGELINQQFLYDAAYNLALPPDTFNPEQTAAKIKH